MTTVLFITLTFAAFAGIDFLLWRSGWRDVQRQFRSSQRVAGTRVRSLSAQAGPVFYQANLHAALGEAGLQLRFAAPFGWGFHKAVVVPWSAITVTDTTADKMELRLGESRLAIYGSRFAHAILRVTTPHGGPEARDNQALQWTGPASGVLVK